MIFLNFGFVGSNLRKLHNLVYITLLFVLNLVYTWSVF